VTPLMAAADYGKDLAVAELLALGADHTIGKADGTLPLHRAASSQAAATDPAGPLAQAGIQHSGCMRSILGVYVELSGVYQGYIGS